jgi:CRP-like cAMP-binding protein
VLDDDGCCVGIIAQADIAMMAGASRESVSRALADWKAERLIGTNNRFKMVLDVGELTQAANRHE